MLRPIILALAAFISAPAAVALADADLHADGDAGQLSCTFD
jgi:hypothetical protein